MASALGILLGIILGAALIGVISWVVYLNLRARRLGLPRPTFPQYFQKPSNAFSSTRDDSAGGVFGFIKSKLPGGSKKSGSSNSRGGFGPLDDGGAWDHRVDTRGYYEDAELGLHVSPDEERDPRGNDRPTYADHWNDGFDSPPRGRSRSRSPRFEDAHETMGGGSRGGTRDPFSDANAMEREPRKSDGFGRPVGVKGGADTPTRMSLEASQGGERRSIFREAM